ncbi:MAG: hypothetical protein KA712_00975 [Myxococcales bacterium]|nr:hypothetical protein [Myxococcales bacterium]MCG5051507.1 hypothetical protein [Myxococcales bacterium]
MLGLELGFLGQKGILLPYWVMVGAQGSSTLERTRVYGEMGVYVIGLGFQGTADEVRPHMFIGVPIPLWHASSRKSIQLLYATPFVRVPILGGPAEFGVALKCVLPWVWQFD